MQLYIYIDWTTTAYTLDLDFKGSSTKIALQNLVYKSFRPAATFNHSFLRHPWVASSRSNLSAVVAVEWRMTISILKRKCTMWNDLIISSHHFPGRVSKKFGMRKAATCVHFQIPSAHPTAPLIIISWNNFDQGF